MRIAFGILGTLIAIIVIIAAIGWMLPIEHQASRQATFSSPAPEIYTLITNVSEFPKWRSGLKSVDVVATESGARSFREHGSNDAILYVVDEAVPNEKLVTRIADPSLPFGGSWTYTLTPAASGTTLRITENGKVYNPLFRFVSHFVISQHATIDTYLTDIGKKLGQTIAITN